MSSSLSARLILLALWVVATFLLSSAQWRVVASDPPRRWRYAMAWFGCALIGSGLLSVVDDAVGQVDWSRRLSTFVFALVLFGLGLGVGAWLTQRPEWLARPGGARFATLALLHAIVVLVVSFPFI